MYFLRMIFAAIVSAIAAYSDYKTRKIKNKLTVSAALIGIISNLIFNDIGIKSSVIAFGLAFFICLPFYMLKMLKAGDIKLYMALGAVLGTDNMIECMEASIICGGIMALIYAVKHKCLKKNFKYLFEYLKNLFYTKKLSPYINSNTDSDKYFPFGIAIFMGVLVKTALSIFY